MVGKVFLAAALFSIAVFASPSIKDPKKPDPFYDANGSSSSFSVVGVKNGSSAEGDSAVGIDENENGGANADSLERLPVSFRTPMESMFKNGYPAFFAYSSYFIKSKLAGKKELFQRILKKRSGRMTYHEGVVKSLYYDYKGYPLVALKIATMLYERALPNLQNSMEGVFIQNLFLKYGKIKEASQIISNPAFCLTLPNKGLAGACFGNVVGVKCALNSDYAYVPADFDEMREPIAFARLYCEKVVKNGGEF